MSKGEGGGRVRHDRAVATTMDQAVMRCRWCVVIVRSTGVCAVAEGEGKRQEYQPSENSLTATHDGVENTTSLTRRNQEPGCGARGRAT